jgi:hypothetical protein
LYFVLGPLALTAPFTSFLRFYDVPFLSSEALYSFAVLSSIGILAGLIMALGGNLTQALISSVITVITVCSETPSTVLYPEGIRFRYIFFLSIFLVGTILYFLREHRIRFLLILFGGMWLVGAISPSSYFSMKVMENSHQADTSLPPYIHIVLDEHIGIEGVPPAYDKEKKLSLGLKNKYLDQGFLTFGRAYSRFNKTEPSFLSFLNFRSSYDSDMYMELKLSSFIPNALYDTLNKQGYIINLFATNGASFDPSDLCNSNKPYRIGKCVITSQRGLNLFHDGALILHNYARKMRILNMYDVVRKKLGTPETNIIMYPHTLKGVKAANEFIDFLGEGKRGNAYFIHLLLPHSPYFLDETCSYNYDGNFFIQEKIDVIYARYVKQTRCAHTLVDKILNKLDSNKEALDSTIIIHGDHGSRIPWHRGGVVNFENEEYIQYFSTFFSIRSPTVTPGYDRRPFALDELLKASSVSKPDFLTLDNKNDKFVYSFPKRGASNRYEAHKKFTLPPFSNGSRAQAW